MSASIEATSSGLALPAASGANARAEAFGRAKRHSRRVRALKWLVPGIAILMAAGFVGYSYILRPLPISIETDGQSVADGKLVMANPKLEGFTKEGRPYLMTATKAVQDLANQGMIGLEGIDARMPVETDNWANVQAGTGVYDRAANTLQLTQNVHVTTTDGMVAKLDTAFLDIGSGGIRSDTPVDIKRDGSTILADSMNILDGGKVLIFERRVRMNLVPADTKAQQQANGGTNASN